MIVDMWQYLPVFQCWLLSFSFFCSIINSFIAYSAFTPLFMHEKQYPDFIYNHSRNFNDDFEGHWQTCVNLENIYFDFYECFFVNFYFIAPA